jgi:hypothetical protein
MYADDSTSAELEKLPVLFTVNVLSNADKENKLSFRKRLVGGQNEYWVFSTFLGAHVKLSTTRVESLERDLSQILPKN